MFAFFQLTFRFLPCFYLATATPAGHRCGTDNSSSLTVKICMYILLLLSPNTKVKSGVHVYKVIIGTVQGVASVLIFLKHCELTTMTEGEKERWRKGSCLQRQKKRKTKRKKQRNTYKQTGTNKHNDWRTSAKQMQNKKQKQRKNPSGGGKGRERGWRGGRKDR